jgi:hypothetical protein
MFIVEACIQRDNNALDFSDNETSDVCVRDGENTIDPDDFLKLGVEVLPCQLYFVWIDYAESFFDGFAFFSGEGAACSIGVAFDVRYIQ